MKEDQKAREIQLERIMENFHGMRRKMFSEGSFGDDEAGITFSQWRVLSFVGIQGNVALKEIAESLSVSSSAATQLVDGLEKAGFVVRSADPDDRRVSSIILSPKAKKFFSVMKAKILERMTPVFSALTDQELALFADLSQKISASAEKNV